jgi:hypothetical protein
MRVRQIILGAAATAAVTLALLAATLWLDARAQAALPVEPQMVHLVWLITESARTPPKGGLDHDNTGQARDVEHQNPPGYPLGVAVFPVEMTLAKCAVVAGPHPLTIAQIELSVMIGKRLGKMIEAPTMLCLTTAEADSLVAAVKSQVDRPGRDA